MYLLEMLINFIVLLLTIYTSHGSWDCDSTTRQPTATAPPDPYSTESSTGNLISDDK